MAVQLKGLWRLDYAALEVGDRIEVYSDQLCVCQLVYMPVRRSADNEPSMRLIVEGPANFLEQLYKKLSDYDRERFANPLFYFRGRIEEGAELDFTPVHSPGTSLGYKASVTRITKLSITPEEVSLPCGEVPEVQNV